MTRFLLTGVGGQLGFELQRELATLGQVHAFDRSLLDISEPDALRECVRALRPDFVVNAAAYTAVDRAETDTAVAAKINATAPGVLAEEVARIGAALIHYSSDYVFDGTKSGAYVENDAPNPLSEYGRTKLAGERAVAIAGATHIILRSTWIYAGRGKNFYRTIDKIATERGELRVVNDQTGAPTWSRMLAQATGQIVARVGSPRGLRDLSGIYHLTSAGSTSWYGFAERIVAARTSRNPSEKVARLVPISTAEYPLPARRPANSVLSNAKIASAFGVVMPDWQQAFDLCVSEH